MKKFFHKKLSYAAILVFVVAILVGYSFADQAYTQNLMTDFLDHADPLFDGQGEMNFFPLLFNNLRVSLMVILVGIIPFLYLPFVFSYINGFLIGVVLKWIYLQGHSPLRGFLLGILPHGIFEFIGLFLAFAAGLTLCHNLTRKILKKESPPIKKVALSCVKTYFYAIVPLFVIAALVECNITPRLWP